MNARTRLKHIFGPVNSRRLGRSLGIDLVNHKCCNLDCLYCECGTTTHPTLDRRRFFPIAELKQELSRFFSQPNHNLDFVTFSGSGEPTLSLDLGIAVEAVRKETSTPVALLTNGLILFDPDVLHDIREIDVLIPSLDAASEEMFNRINRPVSGVDFHRYISGLRQLKQHFPGRVWIEIFLCREINDSAEHLNQLADEIRRIAPDGVQINTLHRPGTDPTLKPLSDLEIERACEILGIVPEVAIAGKTAQLKGGKRTADATLRDSILTILSRRPSTLRDLAISFEMDIESIECLIDGMLSDGLIREVQHPGERFFHRCIDPPA